MSGLAAVLAGHQPSGVYLWHGAFDVIDVRHTVEHAGWGFAHLDGWTGGGTREEFLAAVGRALDFPGWYGENFDALVDCLRDIGCGTHGTVLLWDGWSTLARADDRAFGVALDVLAARAREGAVPFAALLRGEGPPVPGLASLD